MAIDSRAALKAAIIDMMTANFANTTDPAQAIEDSATELSRIYCDMTEWAIQNAAVNVSGLSAGGDPVTGTATITITIPAT